MSVIQGASHPSDHARSGALVATAISPVPPVEAIDAISGLMVIQPEPPAWVTITKVLPTAILPHRGETAPFSATVKFKLPLPAPEAADPRLIQGTEAFAIQVHAPDAETVISPAPPVASNDCAALTELGHTGAGAYATLTFSADAVAEFTVRLRVP